MKLKIAIIGTGIMGSLHARVLSQLSNVNLVAICDTNESAANKLANIYHTKVYLNHKHLLKQESLDGVCIAVPTAYHKEIAFSCIQKDVNLLIEKPLASSVADAQAIVSYANKKNVILSVGHIERFNPVILKLKKLISKGTFGNIVSIVVKRVGLYPPRIKDVNVVTDLAVHDLDIVSNLLEKTPEYIFASGGSGLKRDRIDYADILLDFGNTSCYLQVNWLTPIKVRNISLTGTLGYAELDYITQELIVYKIKSEASNSFPKKFEDFVTKLSNMKKIHIKVNKEEPLKLELQNFIKSIINKQQPLVTGEQGLLAVKLSEMALDSIRSKKLIKFRGKQQT